MLNTNRVLVIERDAKMRRLLRLELEANHYAVHEGDTGEDAVIKSAKLLPELVLLDIGVTDMNVFNVLEHLHESMSPFIIVLLERSSPRIKRKVLETGANAYLVKPFSMDDIGVYSSCSLSETGANSLSRLHQ